MRKAVVLFVLIGAAHSGYAQEEAENKTFSFIPMASYEYVHLDAEAIHSPSLGLAVTAGDYDKGFMDIHKSFLALSNTSRCFLQNAGMPELFTR